MFTGIITDLGEVQKLDKGSRSLRLSIKTRYNTGNIAIGASIACNGCCLTVIEKSNNILVFDVSPETLDKTTLNSAKLGDLINLEQATKVGDELGGHLVTGHIDGVAEVVSIKEIENNWQIKFKLPANFKKYIAAKGSVTINGTSLTVNNVENDLFEVNIIPHTLEQTNLKLLKVGSKVNFEIDLIARYLERLLEK